MTIPGLSINFYLCPPGYGADRFAGEVAAAGAAAIALSIAAFNELGAAGCRRAAADNGLAITTLNSAGDFLICDMALAAAQADSNLRLIDAAAEMGARALVVVTGGLSGQAFLDDHELRDRNLIRLSDAHKTIAESLCWLNERARAADVQLALEPIHPMDILFKGVVNSLAHAGALTEEVPGLGLILDVYHSWWDPGLATPPAATVGVQICGLDQANRDMKPDRVPLAESFLPVAPIVRHVLSAAPGAFVEFEMFDRHRRGREVKDIVTATMTAWQQIVAELEGPADAVR
ncbi:MAG: TIM barrel protein [Pseudolabrys sp.]|jgi:sugar phosphate isomerase/epimerase